MPIPNTRVLLGSTVLAGGGVKFTPNAVDDISATVTGTAAPAWLAGVGDLDGDGLVDFIFGAPGDDDKDIDAGRVFVSLGALTAGSTGLLGDGSVGKITIDGVNAGDRAGASVGSVSDMDGDGLSELLVGAPGMEVGSQTDAGAGFVLWGMAASGGIDLDDPFTGSGKGFAIKGEGAGDAAGIAMGAVGDLNGDGKAEVLIGAAGNDAGGANAGAAYVVFGRSSETNVLLTNVAAGIGGYKITGEAAGDGIGAVLGRIGDLNGDGLDEVLIGAAGNDAGGAGAGAVYVVYGKASGTNVLLADVALGTGGYKITGIAGDGAGAAVSRLGDINGDGLDDMLIGAAGGNTAYVVYGSATGAAISLADVALGTGGFRIIAEGAGDLETLSLGGGADLNRDGVNDLVIGAMHNDEGGNNAGAVYVVWGGATSTVDLSLVALGIGGAKVVGAAGSLTGATVSVTGDASGDGVADLLIGAPGTGESAYALFSPLGWQPDHNIYGTTGADLITAGFGAADKVGAGDDVILALAGNDTVDSGDGHDSIEGGAGNDALTGSAGNDTLDGGTGADTLTGGTGDDTYIIDSALDVVTEGAGEGSDTVVTSVAYTLAADLEALVLTGMARSGTGNAGDNSLTGSAGNDTLNGAAGADTMTGGLGSDHYTVEDAGDLVVEGMGEGSDTVTALIDHTLGDNIEGLILSGAARTGIGNALANSMVGTDANDRLNGLGGIDTMVGGLGNDTYVVNHASDVTTEAANAGTDRVLASADYTLGANVEDLILRGAARLGTGNAQGNRLTGSDFDDTLDGAGGSDTLKGGLGNDAYIVDSATDIVIDGAGEGADTVFASADYRLGGSEIEDLVLLGAARLGTGNALDNRLTGTAGNDTLDGATGADTMTGGAGDDTYLVDTAGDVISEAAGEGFDGVASKVDHTLGDNVEALSLLRHGLTGTGNALDNLLSGANGQQTLIGGDGADTLDGGIGADRMEGGTGDDTYYVDNRGDLVIEAANEGTDTVITTVNTMTFGDTIEIIRLAGTATVATGNASDNRISGSDNDDRLDGGDGDDLLLGGGGDDDLHCHSGIDTLSGGGGGDTYHVSGGPVEIEDFHGHDEIDASDADGDSYIDLSGETESEIEYEVCHFTQGGTSAGPLDVQFLQDLSGSFADDIGTVRALVPNIVSALQAVQADSLFGVSTFIDKPVTPFGATGEWVYETPLALTADASALTATYASIGTLNGADGPEAQLEALMQLALHSADVGYRSDSARFVVLFTDAPFHLAGDGASGGITTPNNGDGLTPGGGALEDYPEIAQVAAALAAANIIPVFAIAGGYESTYAGLVTALGRGSVVTLTADSSNVVAAITTGLTLATTTHIEDATGGMGDDTLLGGGEDNRLTGNLGSDHLDGRLGDDSLSGGTGDDSLEGGEGDDTLDGNSGDDTAIFTGAASTVRLGLTGTQDTGHGMDVLLRIEHVTSGAGDDDLRGNSHANLLTGGAGNDLLIGNAGNDTLLGEGGHDKLIGGAGDDMLVGGAGVDTAIFTGTGAVTVDLALLTAQNTGQGLDRLSEIENLRSGSGNDALAGDAGANAIWANAGADTLTGAGGDDDLYGGAGADVFVFAAGHGANLIHDFADGQDLMQISAPGGFADLTITAQGIDTQITFADVSILLAGVDALLIDAGDFLFA